MGCRKDQPGPTPIKTEKEVVASVLEDPLYNKLNDNVLKIAQLTKLHEATLLKHAEKIKRLKTNEEATEFFNSIDLNEFIVLGKENDRLSVELARKHPQLDKVSKVNFTKESSIDLKAKMEMGYYDDNGVYVPDEYNDPYAPNPYDPYAPYNPMDTVVTKGPIDFCYDAFVIEEQRCLRDFTVELAFAVIAAGFGGGPGLIVMGHGVVLYNVCKYDADINFEECVKQAGGQ